MRTSTLRLLCGALLCVALGGSPAVRAEGQDPGASATTGAAKSEHAGGSKKSKKTSSRASSKGRRGSRGPRKVVELEALVIEGRVQKPEVFYVIGRARSRYEQEKLDRSFVGRILETARKDPF